MYGVFVLANTPAAWLYSHVLKSHLGGVALFDIKGTVWEGRAAMVRTDTLQLDNLHWDLHPWALLWGKLEAAVNFDLQAAPAHMIIARSITGAWYLTEAAMELPAQQLEPLLRMPGAELGGNLRMVFPSFIVRNGRVTAVEGSVTWHKASLRKPLAVELGSFELVLETGTEGVTGKLLDQGGAVQAQGVFKLQADGAYQFTAVFASRDPQQPLVTQGLRLFGSSAADGRVNYTASGVLPPLMTDAG